MFFNCMKCLQFGCSVLLLSAGCLLLKGAVDQTWNWSLFDWMTHKIWFPYRIVKLISICYICVVFVFHFYLTVYFHKWYELLLEKVTLTLVLACIFLCAIMLLSKFDENVSFGLEAIGDEGKSSGRFWGSFWWKYIRTRMLPAFLVMRYYSFLRSSIYIQK